MTTGVVLETQRRISKAVARQLYAGVPDPQPSLESLTTTVAALKLGFEHLTRARGSTEQSAVLVQDLDTFAEVLLGALEELYLPLADVPSSSTSPGTAGQVAFTEEYLYLCVKKDQWRRVALEEF